MGGDHRAAPRHGAVHRPVQAGRRRQAPRAGRVHPRAQARARLPPAPRPPARRRAPAGGDPPAADSPAAAVGTAAEHEAKATPHPVPRDLAPVARRLPVAPGPRVRWEAAQRCVFQPGRGTQRRAVMTKCQGQTLKI